MQINKTRFENILAITLFCCYLIHLTVNLERIILFNEIMILFSVIYLLKRPVMLRDIVSIFILVWLAYGFVRLIFSASFQEVGSFYQVFRTLPLWYSVLAFYFGYSISYKGWSLIKNNKKVISLSWISLMLFGYKLSTSMLLVFLSKNSRTILIMFPIFFLIKNLILGGDGNSTLIVISVFLLMYYIFKSFCLKLLSIVFHWAFFSSLFIAISIFLFWFSKENYLFYEIGYEYWDFSDGNLIWRLMFWAYEMEKVISESPLFGIGLGTPLFDRYDTDVDFIINSSPNDLQTQFTLGLHNSFLTIVTRLGWVGLIIYSLITSLVFKRCIKRIIEDNAYPEPFLAMVSFVIAASFNVILESPLYSGVFWAMLGFIYRFYDEK